MSGQSSRGPTIVRLGRSYSGEETNFLANLRRTNTSNPWGFRMLGGIDQGSCLYVHKVNPKSIAERSGMRPGDGIMAVNGVSTQGMTHDQAKMEILRAGNELDFYLSRNAMPVSSAIVKRQESMEESRAEIIEDPSDFNTGYQNPNVQSRSFKILQEALSYTEAPDDAAIMRNEPPPVVRNEPHLVMRNEQRYVVRNEQRSVMRNEQPSLMRNEPHAVRRNEPPVVMRNEPPVVMRNEPPPIVRNDPSEVMKNVPPGQLLSITDLLQLTGYS